MAEYLLAGESVIKMITEIEESTRATAQGVARFIEPAEGTLRRAVSRQHHIVFGRRGSGKTSLLKKAAGEMSIERRPIAFVDLEQFKGHTYPDVLLSVLIATFRSFDEWLAGAGRTPASRWKFWQWFGRKPSRPPLPKAQVESLSKRLRAQIAELEALLHSADNIDQRETARSRTEKESREEGGAELVVPQAGSLGGKKVRGGKESDELEVTSEFRRTKTDFLLRHIMDYQAIFREMSNLAGGDCFLFLDDLYHIPRRVQPDLLDYFHRIAKGNQLWLKIGTIRHRTEWYRHGDPPIGLKLGDEAQDIDLDLTLERYQTTKDFLFKILHSFAKPNGIALDEILAAGARDRLVPQHRGREGFRRRSVT